MDKCSAMVNRAIAILHFLPLAVDHLLYSKRSYLMIIDCHGHYTTTPPQIEAYRNEQRALLAKDQNHIFAKGHVTISDDEIRDSIVNNQLKVQQDRGTDVTIFSPRASWMGQDLGNASTSEAWTGICNDLIRRVCDLFPKILYQYANCRRAPKHHLTPASPN